MSRRKRYDSGRMAGGFVAMPWVVLDSEAYKQLSHQARSLLFEFARQIDPKGGQNGQLLATGKYLRKRGWSTSNDTITKAKRELLEGGFIYETVMGHRPNRASWYAVTWHQLAPHNNYDPGAERGFRRGAFMDSQPLPKPKPTRQELYRKWDKQNTSPTPPHGVGKVTIAPPHGVEASAAAPPHGAMRPVFAPRLHRHTVTI